MTFFFEVQCFCANVLEVMFLDKTRENALEKASNKMVVVCFLGFKIAGSAVVQRQEEVPIHGGSIATRPVSNARLVSSPSCSSHVPAGASVDTTSDRRRGHSSDIPCIANI
jgi:hypothetical protein